MKTMINKTDFKNSNPLIGSWVTLAHPAIAEIMANADFDWLAIDLEHSTITIREAEELIRVIELSGVTPLVRLTSNNPDLIKRIMDAGAHGIIVPMVNSEADAQNAVQAIKYPPIGSRGVGLARAQKYGSDFDSYKKWQKDGSIVLVQIEHIEAVKNLREILSVNYIDGFIVGPYDLTSSMGIPGEFSNTKFVEVMNEIRVIADEMNIPSGVHIIEPDSIQLKLRIEEGFKFIGYSLDIRMLDHSCQSAFSKIK